MNRTPFRISLLLSVVLLITCSEKNHPSSPVTVEGKTVAFFVIDETDLSVDTLVERMVAQNTSVKSFIALLASDLLAAPASTFDTMTIQEVLLYGLQSIIDRSGDYYDTTVIIRGDTLNMHSFLRAATGIAGQASVMDMFFFLHGSDNHIAMGPNDGTHIVPVYAVTDSLQKNEVAVRMLFQTCCYGKTMIDEWEQAGICAVNGAEEIYIPFTGPFRFFNDWVEGKPYSECIKNAYDRDSVLFNAIENIAGEPGLEEIVDEWLAGSRQTIGGASPDITIDLSCRR